MRWQQFTVTISGPDRPAPDGRSCPTLAQILDLAWAQNLRRRPPPPPYPSRRQQQYRLSAGRGTYLACSRRLCALRCVSNPSQAAPSVPCAFDASVSLMTATRSPYA